jgi:FAD/FMN-containing dehydrogenase/Fe-S oxidoreductase
MNTPAPHPALARATCDIRTDTATRQLFATDASVYQIEPAAVAFPKSVEECVEAIGVAVEAGLSVHPRGGGTGLAGGALGNGMVIDFSRHNRAILEYNAHAKRLRVEPGVVLSELNRYVAKDGLRFGPDVATGSRATLGGMIANNSSGSHAPVYGTTSDHVLTLDAVLANGDVVSFNPQNPAPNVITAELSAELYTASEAIAERMPNTLIKRWPGYALDDYFRDGCDPTKLWAGSEGTLGAIVSAELQLVPVPDKPAIGLIFFDSVADAMQAAVELGDLAPAAIEHIDAVLFDQTKGHRAFQATRDLLQLDEKPCESILIVEFFDNAYDKLAQLQARDLGVRKQAFMSATEMEMVWNLRKAGLSLLTGCKGSSKPAAGIEDAAVRPEQLPAYVAALQGAMGALGLHGSFYGHAASGLLHVRPVVDLHDADDIAKYRKLAQETSAIVRQFKASLAGEHGVGIARTEFMPEQLGDETLAAMRAVKAAFDPGGVMNPGKIIPGKPVYHINTNLRQGRGSHIELPFKEMLGYVEKDESFVGNLEQCNGNGACRKMTPSMCPTYIATGEEIESTRGRANIIRAALEGRLDAKHPLDAPALWDALSDCVACKACATECPSNVNMALLKSELLHAKYQRKGKPLQARLFANADAMGQWGTRMPGLANAFMRSKPVRALGQRMGGVSAQRALPLFTTERFDTWFENRKAKPGERGRVILWDDTFVRYHEPHIGRAAVAVLEAAGYEVALAANRKCCGRPAFSVGLLDEARKLANHNAARLYKTDDPIVVLEPSCYSMFVQDYRELGVPNAAAIAKRTILFDAFIENLLAKVPDALAFNPGFHWIAVHGHCHAKALNAASATATLFERLPNATVTKLETGCCGMAGSFGYLESKQALSRAVAQPLVDQINDLTAGTEVAAMGTSCRHQIDDLTPIAARHPAEILAEALVRPDSA